MRQPLRLGPRFARVRPRMKEVPMTRPIRKAVLPVAGLGTRVLPATKVLPKELLPVFDRPALAHIVSEAFEAGIQHLIMVTGRNKGAIEDYFDRAFELEETLRVKGKITLLGELQRDLPSAGSISFVRQQEPKGLGHAVWCARQIVGDEPFAVILPDMLMMAQPGCLSQLVQAYGETGGNYVAVEPTDDPSSYGIVDPGERQGRRIAMRGMVEKPKASEAPSNLSISGRYLLQPSIFEALEHQQPGAGGEIQLTDSMAACMQSEPYYAYEYEGITYDCGSKLGYLRAFCAYALRSPDGGDQAAAALKEELARTRADSI